MGEDIQPPMLFVGTKDGEFKPIGEVKVLKLETPKDESKVEAFQYHKTFSFQCETKVENGTIKELFYYKVRKFTKAEIKRFVKVVEHYGYVVFVLNKWNVYIPELGEGKMQLVCDTPKRIKRLMKYLERCRYKLYDKNWKPINHK